MFRKMRTFFRRRLPVTAVAFVAAAAAVVTPVLPTEEATAQQRCPSVAVIAARGSGQNNQIYRTRYAGEAPWTSNGWEGETIRAFLRYSESRYRATHGGNSLMKDVEVLGMEPRYYPAIYRIMMSLPLQHPRRCCRRWVWLSSTRCRCLRWRDRLARTLWTASTLGALA